MASKDLLKVLDMDDDEQHDWCARCPECRMGNESLPDLAFRLRDEAKALTHDSGEWGEVNSFYEATKEVYHKATTKRAFVHELEEWWMYQAKPIHWIIAALIAKENKHGK